MVDFTIVGEQLIVDVVGLHQLWALKSRIEVPLDAIVSIRADPEFGSGLFHGWRMPGTSVPGLITAGTYYLDGERTFWDVVRRRRVVVLELEGHDYDRLVVEVADPAAAVALIEAAIGGPGDEAAAATDPDYRRL